MSKKIRFNTEWNFSKQPLGQTVEGMSGKDIPWQKVDLPHDWLIYQAKDLYETSEGWYQRDYYYEKEESKGIALYFDGVYMNSTLYMNGLEVGQWKYGYSSFEFEITSFLVPGKNDIKMRVIHESPNSRWYSGAGIYRNVWLRTFHSTHFVTDGIYISTSKHEDTFHLLVSHESTGNPDATVIHKLLDSNGSPIQTDIPSDQSVPVNTPNLWTLENPYLYTLHSMLLLDGEIVDEEFVSFGFRECTYDAEKGFLLNGKHIKLNGVCEHHDLGALGSAVNTAALKRRLSLLKKMGCNAIRTSHNMPAPELLKLADTMGFLIVDEAFDMWERSKTQYDYARFFKEWSSKDVASWIRRDRNHPCVIMWSIGNEIYDTHADAHGQEVTRYLLEEVRNHDPRENAKVTIGSNYMPWENARNCADIVKYAGYNYAEKYYQNHHKEHPGWFIYGSETSSIVQSRGIYHFPLGQAILSDDDEQCSSLGNSTTSWGSKSLEACALWERDTPFSLGQFLWTGFDYIGEPTPYHTKNSYFGQLDTAGFPKDAFYFYQSVWTDYRVSPMIHIAPYWDFNEGQRIDVRVFSNAPVIELFLNGCSLGKQELEHTHGRKLIGDWQLPYEKGKLLAIAYDEHGTELARKEKSSFEDAATIELKPDKLSMVADGEDIIFVTISMKDHHGYDVQNANNRVHVTVSGAGRLVGLDNGDSTDFDEYKGMDRRLFSGKLLAMVQSNLEVGPIEILVSSPSLPSTTLELDAVPSELAPEVTSHLSCYPTEPSMEIPIRKIELIVPDGNAFTKECNTLTVTAKLYPENSSYDSIAWRITNDAGVDVKTATYACQDASGKTISLTAHGDGDFRLRAFSCNGREHPQILSELEFHATGLGELFLNPYDFISGSLYDSYSGEVSSGNDRGVATARDQVTRVTYTNLDFGHYGSDMVTMPIFELDSAKTLITLTENNPLTGEVNPLGTFTYHKKSQWNVYQEETFHLNKRLTGITSLTMEVEHKIHLKGFSFKRLEKAYELLYAKEADHLYGDTFTVTEDSVEGIGNNVSLEFLEMNFGEHGTTKLTICGRCPIDKNTIQIRFHGGNEDVNQLAEFTHTEDYEEKVFSLTPITGMQNVTFVFLPGSRFDFRWFRFETKEED